MPSPDITCPFLDGIIYLTTERSRHGLDRFDLRQINRRQQPERLRQCSSRAVQRHKILVHRPSFAIPCIFRPSLSHAEPPRLSLATVQATVGSAPRWAILRELADGSSLMLSELAERTNMTPSAVSKQLSALVSSWIVIHPRGRLYEIAPDLITNKAERILDFGYCLLRMNVGVESA